MNNRTLWRLYKSYIGLEIHVEHKFNRAPKLASIRSTLNVSIKDKKDFNLGKENALKDSELSKSSLLMGSITFFSRHLGIG